MKPGGRVTAEGGGWAPGGLVGRELVPGLTCSPAGGWRRRLPQPRGPPELRHGPDGARSGSCPRPAPGDVRLHTYTRGGGRRPRAAPNFLPASAGRRGEGAPAPGVLGEGAPTRKETRWGDNSTGFVGGGEFFFFFNHFHQRTGECRAPGAGRRGALGGNGRVCLETRKVAFQAPTSGASDAPRRADSELPGPPCHPPGSDASPVCHLDPCSPARNRPGLGEERGTGTRGVARPPRPGKKRKGKGGAVARAKSYI